MRGLGGRPANGLLFGLRPLCADVPPPAPSSVTSTPVRALAVDGVVIATEKKVSSILVDDTSVDRISTISENVGVVYSGMAPDFRVLVDKSRKSAEKYTQMYGETMPVSQLVRDTASVMQEFTQRG